MWSPCFVTKRESWSQSCPNSLIINSFRALISCLFSCVHCTSYDSEDLRGESHCHYPVEVETKALASILSGQFELTPKVKSTFPLNWSPFLSVTILGCAGPVVELGRIASLSTDHEFCHDTYTLEQLHELSGLRVEDIITSLCS